MAITKESLQQGTEILLGNIASLSGSLTKKYDNTLFAKATDDINKHYYSDFVYKRQGEIISSAIQSGDIEKMVDDTEASIESVIASVVPENKRDDLEYLKIKHSLLNQALSTTHGKYGLRLQSDALATVSDSMRRDERMAGENPSNIALALDNAELYTSQMNQATQDPAATDKLVTEYKNLIVTNGVNEQLLHDNIPEAQAILELHSGSITEKQRLALQEKIKKGAMASFKALERRLAVDEEVSHLFDVALGIVPMRREEIEGTRKEALNLIYRSIVLDDHSSYHIKIKQALGDGATLSSFFNKINAVSDHFITDNISIMNSPIKVRDPETGQEVYDSMNAYKAAEEINRLASNSNIEPLIPKTARVLAGRITELRRVGLSHQQIYSSIENSPVSNDVKKFKRDSLENPTNELKEYSQKPKLFKKIDGTAQDALTPLATLDYRMLYDYYYVEENMSPEGARVHASQDFRKLWASTSLFGIKMPMKLAMDNIAGDGGISRIALQRYIKEVINATDFVDFSTRDKGRIKYSRDIILPYESQSFNDKGSVTYNYKIRIQDDLGFFGKALQVKGGDLLATDFLITHDYERLSVLEFEREKELQEAFERTDFTAVLDKSAGIYG